MWGWEGNQELGLMLEVLVVCVPAVAKGHLCLRTSLSVPCVSLCL